MSGFSADWLRLREPVDLAARNGQVEAAFLSALPKGPVRLMDLASGAGSTVAALSDRLGASQDWLLTDNDPALLEVSRKRYSQFGKGAVACRQVDLSADLASLPFAEVDGVMTSAFLDLVTRPFLERLVGLVTAARLPFLASLTYDGRASCTPADPFDEDIRQAMNAHQKTDKGFGAALGPDAADAAEALFAAAGYRVVSGPSDWHAGREARDFQRELISGWVSAGLEMGLEPERLSGWLDRRMEQISDGNLVIEVGHRDIAAIPV
ncbi:class I SAM-dependent methyltransferase [Roseibium aggregatum]|uniref:Class I SAM-dependent methyltransferase n=1 Tax=Roseibium aggregatum TaxID=187304 RepID=A0A926S822_9HYPH|nr:class I SAM-dependent methyltransferase [Roseibium aggregatum]MBD1548965.1 class I SAM-dependent methyltransferase [Roseibium aggregatum]